MTSLEALQRCSTWLSSGFNFLGFVGAWINMLNDSYMILPYVSSSRTFWHLSRAQFFKDEAVTAGGP